jgi:HEAT repeat protein
VEPDGDGALKAAMAALDDPDEAVRRAAVDAIAKLEERGRPAEAKLFGLLNDPGLRGPARDSLRAIHPTSVPALIDALGHSDWSVREMAADGLARLAKGAVEAQPALEKAVREDPHDEVKRACRRPCTPS